MFTLFNTFYICMFICTVLTHHPYIADSPQVISENILFLQIISSILTSVEEVGEIYGQM